MIQFTSSKHHDLCLRVSSSQNTFSTPKHDAPSNDQFYDPCAQHTIT